MIHIFIDESGDIGNPIIPANSKSFSMAACFCESENTDYLSKIVETAVFKLKKKELKFSKMSHKEKIFVQKTINQLGMENVSVFKEKTKSYHGKDFLREVFSELIDKIPIRKNKKVKVFIDGSENAFFRKIYTPIIKKKFPQSILLFGNSQKKHLIQVADFYAGERRRLNE